MSEDRNTTTPEAAPRFWSRFRETFGPALVGLIGGGLTIGVALTATVPLLKNAANTYAEFPSLLPPGLIRDVSIPSAVLVPLAALGVIAPFAMGLVTAWLVRRRDRWDQASAGLMTGVTSGLAACVVGLGWAVALATTVVPSIADLTLFAEATKTPAVAGEKPADAFLKYYPDLARTPADERGGLFFAKIVSDQVAGTAYGVWLGVGLSMASVGSLGLFGTLVGSWLLRRGGSWRGNVVPYLELTVATALATGRLVGGVAGYDESLTWFGAAALLAATALVVFGVVGRWNALLRVAVAVTWVLVFAGAGFGGSRFPAAVAYLAYGALLVLLYRRWYRASHQPVLAPT
jgi:hypothetical protein